MAGTEDTGITAFIATARAGIMAGTAAIIMAGTSIIGITDTTTATTITGVEPRSRPIRN